MKTIIWALGTNGEGSSQLVSQFIQKANYKFENEFIFVTHKNALLYRKLDISIKKSSKARYLPSFLSFSLMHFILKIVGFTFLKKNNLIVLDDFPFFFVKNQILLLHQPNLVNLNNKSLKWKLRRIAFRILLSKDCTLVVQTEHMAEKIKDFYRHTNLKVLLHSST